MEWFLEGLPIYGLIALPFLLFAILKRTGASLVFIISGMIILPIVMLPLIPCVLCDWIRYFALRWQGYRTVKGWSSMEEAIMEKKVDNIVVDTKKLFAYYDFWKFMSQKEEKE